MKRFLWLLVFVCVCEAQIIHNVRKNQRPVKEGDSLFEKELFPDSKEEDSTGLGGHFTRIDMPDLDQLEESFSEVWGRLFGSESEEGAIEDSSEDWFSRNIPSMFKPWWKGENVCKSEKIEMDDRSDEEGLLGQLFSTACQDLGDVYTCTMRAGNKEGKLETKKIQYECCHGFTRERGKQGCTQKVELKSMMGTLEMMNLTKFAEAIETTGLAAELSEQNLTLFVPTNDALTSAIDTEEVDFVLLNSEDKQEFTRDIVKGHMIDGWVSSQGWRDEMTKETENEGTSLRLNRFSSPRPFWTVNCARVLSTNKKTKSGVIHTVDRLILPPRQSLWDILSGDPSYSIFASLVSTELQDKLMSQDKAYSVFAFTDEAFAAAPESIQEKIRSEDSCMKDYAWEMVAGMTLCSEAIHGQARISSLRRRGHYNLNVTRTHGVDGWDMFLEGVEVKRVDMMATNGVLHSLDGVPLLDHMKDVLYSAKQKGGEKFAEKALEYDLPSLMRDFKHTTIFLPVDKAFKEGEALSEEEMKNHIVNNLVEVGRKNQEVLVETLAEQTLSLSTPSRHHSFIHGLQLSSHKANIGCASILAANIPACHGTIHLIDRVLRISTENVMELLRGDEDKSEFTTLIELAELDELLASPEFSGTVLAPSNAKLTEYLESVKEEGLLEDKAALKAFLERHILTERVCCNSLGGSSVIFQSSSHRTKHGTRVFSGRRGGNKHIGGVQVEKCDVQGTNGLIHGLSGPITRPRRISIWELFPTNKRSHRRQNRRRNRGWPF